MLSYRLKYHRPYDNNTWNGESLFKMEVLFCPLQFRLDFFTIPPSHHPPKKKKS